ncbi:AAA-ATPase At3g28580-like [Silene latifolia]|uniref:AAA-ATPase At3g28580-like n=1 Tax=Silene latifolia TaxID=37657 RepID=UPI003D78146E
MRKKTSTLSIYTKIRPLELLFFVCSILKNYAPFRKFVLRYTHQLIKLISPYIHLYIDEYSNDNWLGSNEIYCNVRAYLGEHGSKTSRNLRVNTLGGNRVFQIADEEEVTDTFRGVTVWWALRVTVLPVKDSYPTKAYKLVFHRKYRELISGEYLDHVISEGKMVLEKNRIRKIYVNKGLDSKPTTKLWTSVDFRHPANFDNLAMDPEKKREIVEDLLKFSKSKDFYARVGKAWKRGYLLYGPPGTGKSTMIAAMANLLGYDVYDLELTAVSSNEQLRKLLINTKRRSIIAIEDIDCSLAITKNRNIDSDSSSKDEKDSKGSSANTTEKKPTGVTLSGLLNFIDGIWSSSEGERIIIFTTNAMHKLDPALIRAGRMDKHIEMGYCCFEGFKVLAKNYLLLETHPKFDAIKSLLAVTKMSPADVAEHLIPKLPNEDDEKGLDNLIRALEKAQADQAAKEKASELKLKKVKTVEVEEAAKVDEHEEQEVNIIKDDEDAEEDAYEDANETTS